MKGFFKIMLPIILGVTFGLVLFTLGNAEDAPGLSLFGIVFPFILWLDGEIELFSIIFIMGIVIGIALTAFAVIQLIRVRNKEKI